MTKVDVVVIGAGAAGLTAGALLAKNGKKVLVLDKAPYLGGRGMAVPDEGFKLNLGGHLLEDSGSGITKVFEHLGKHLGHGPANTDMNVWDHTTDAWGSIRDRYSGNKDELKKVIKTLLDTPYEELEKWDDRSLREWIHQYTDDQGVIDLFEFISVLECMTEHWWDHSASDNLFVRKMHYTEKRSAAYSFWPEQGWDGLFQDLADAVAENGGEVRLGESVHKVVIENHEVKGVAVARKPRILPNDYETELIEADCVISTLPVWHVLQVVPEWELPDWYVGQIKYLAQDHFRIAWLGLYLAVERARADPRPARALDMAALPDGARSRASSSSRRHSTRRPRPRASTSTSAAGSSRARTARTSATSPRSSTSSSTTSGRCTRASRSRSGAVATSSSSRRSG